MTNVPPAASSAVVELRQYTLEPGRRDVLIDLFEREFIESQEALGIRVIGLFRDLDRPNHFVWLRGFPNMQSRQESLAAFYGGPVWTAHRDVANATMLDSDDVLLLRPTAPATDFASLSRDDADRPDPDLRTKGRALTATVFSLRAPVDPGFVSFLAQTIEPELARHGSRRIALLETEPAVNSFPGLPVREGEHVVVRIAAQDGGSAADAHRAATDLRRWPAEMLDRLQDPGAAPTQHLRLEPTARSPLR